MKLFLSVSLAVCSFSFAFSGCGSITDPDSSRPVPVVPKTESEPASGSILASDIRFYPTTGDIHYTLPEPALVRIRIGIPDGGPLLRTLIDWERRDAGPHVEIWDGKDSSRQVDFRVYNNVAIALFCLPIDVKSPKTCASTIRGHRKSPRFFCHLSRTF